LKQIEKIKSQADIRRKTQNDELQGLADQVKEVTLNFPAKAGDTGKLYGSITTQEIAVALTEKVRYEIKRQQVDTQPIRALGQFTAHIRLTMDLVPEIKIVVYREGESPESITNPEAAAAAKAEKKKGGRKVEEKAEPAAESESPAAAE
jgi:large subunit ribosomal protein L9